MADTLMTINLFPNDGLRKGEQGPAACFSVVTDTDGRQIQVTAADFLAGWQGKIPPFSNNAIRFNDPVSLRAGVTYESPGWANNDLKAEDATGKKILLQRNGREMKRFEDQGEPVGEHKMVRYLNVTLSVAESRVQQSPQPVAAPAGQGRYEV